MLNYFFFFTFIQKKRVLTLFVPISNQNIVPFKFVHVSTVNDKEKNISGIIEAASFSRYVINLGDRQKGRARGANVFDCSCL